MDRKYFYDFAYFCNYYRPQDIRSTLLFKFESNLLKLCLKKKNRRQSLDRNYIRPSFSWIVNRLLCVRRILLRICISFWPVGRGVAHVKADKSGFNFFLFAPTKVLSGGPAVETVLAWTKFRDPLRDNRMWFLIINAFSHLLFQRN